MHYSTRYSSMCTIKLNFQKFKHTFFPFFMKGSIFLAKVIIKYDVRVTVLVFAVELPKVRITCVPSDS